MPDGTVGSSASALQNRDSVAEVFEAKKQVGLEGLSKEIQEALKGVEGEPGEIVERIKSLAESKAGEVRGSLDQMHAVLQQEGGKINTEVSGITEAIQSLNDDTREKVQEALERFQMKLAQAVKDIEVDVLDKEIEILQDRVDDLERKKKRNEKDKGEPPLSPEEEAELVAKQAEVDQLEAKSRKWAGKPEGTAPSSVSTSSAEATNPEASSPEASVSTATPDTAPPTPETPSPVELFSDAEKKEMEEKMRDGEKRLAEAGTVMNEQMSAEKLVAEQKKYVEGVKGGYEELLIAYKRIYHAGTAEEKATAESTYSTARSVIAGETNGLRSICDGLTIALKETAAKVIVTKTPEIQTQEKVLINYAKALKSVLDGISEHVPEIASIALDVPEPTVIPTEPTPDLVAPSGIDASPTPDKPPSAPEAAGSFEQVVAADEARLAEVKQIMAEWGSDKGERPPQDADIQRVVDAYEGVINAERAYINAEKESERRSFEKKMKNADKALPKASALLNQLMEDFRGYASKAEGPDGYVGKEKWGAAWKAKIDARIAVLDILNKTLKKVDAPAKAPKPAEVAPAAPAAPAPDAPKAPTPDAAPAPPATPDAPKTPDSSPPAPAAGDEGTQYGPRTLEGEVSHETDLLGRIDALLEKMRRTKDLDDADTETSFGDLGEVLIRAQEGMELLEEASKEVDDTKRQDLFVKRDVILRDPAILAKAEAYMKKMVEFMRNADTEDMEQDVEIKARIEAFELVSELFPSLRAKIGDLKREREETAVLEFPERAEWQAWVSKNKRQVEAVKRAIGGSADEAWYKEAKERIEKNLAFQEGVIARTEAVLAAKTSADRQRLSKELWEFRRKVHAMPRILPGETLTGVQAKIDRLEEEYGQLKDEGDEGKRKKAQEEKRAKIEKLKHLLAVVRLDDDLFLESDLHVTSTDDAMAAYVKKRQEQNAMRNPGEARVSESPEDIHKDLENEAGNEHEELRELVAVGKAMRKLFSEARSAYAPYEDTKKTFLPIYEGWKEEQEASAELLDVQCRRGFNTHFEIWATRGLRTLDRMDEKENLTDEAWEALMNSEGVEKTFGKIALDQNERNVGAIKAHLYDVIRKVTQSKIKTQEAYRVAEERAKGLAGTTRAKLEEAGQELEATLEKTSLELKQLSSKIETMQGPPEKGGNPVRWKREGSELLARESILRYAQQNAADRKADYDELLEALTDKTKPSSNDAEEIVLPFALQEGVNTRLAAIMKKQTERGQTTEKVRAQAAQAVYKANPRMMDVEIRTTSSAAMGGDIKRESIGGGTAPKGAYESFKGTWAGKLMSPFLSVIEGLFK